MNELERRDALQPGMLVWYNTIHAGDIPCRILERNPGRFSTDRDLLTLKVTARKPYGTYRPGEIITTGVGPFVRAR